MAKKRGFLGYNALLGDGSVMTSYTPTVGERMTDALRRMMFSDDRAGQQRAEKVMDVLSLTPVGAAADVYDAGREAGAGNYGTAGLMLGMAGIPGPSPKKGIRAFHGSPHSFERFDMSKIGTGEGAQAYGHGLYFAENEDVAKGYRDTLSKSGTDGARRRFEKAGGDIDAAIAAAKAKAAQYRAGGADNYASAVEEDLRFLEKFKQTGEWTPGSMYEVNINADPEQFLDWDKPLSEQPPQMTELVRQALKDKGYLRANDNGPRQLTSALKAWRMAEGGMAETSMEALLGGRGGMLGQTAAEASTKLREAGIPGIKYLDAGSRRAGDGTRNYVVFDERLIEIVRKYGIAGASAMLGYNLLEGMDPAQAEELKRIEGGR
jgi:hypothetical protein